MRILIVEDEFVSRRVLKEYLSPYGDCDVVVDGEEAIEAFRLAWDEGNPYNLICLDIMMPNMDGQEALKRMRDFEKERGVKGPSEAKIIMVTALDDPKSVVEAFYKGGATSYIVKPLDRAKLIQEIRSFGLIK